jgi:hypothetical protein
MLVLRVLRVPIRIIARAIAPYEFGGVRVPGLAWAETFSPFPVLIDPGDCRKHTLRALLRRFFEAHSLLDGDQHRQRPVVTHDEEALTGGCGIQDLAELSPKIKGRHGSHGQPS